MDHATFDRRTMLRAAGTAAAGAALGSVLPALGALGPSPAFAARTDFGVSVYAFPLSAVKLQAGPFLDNMNRTLAYLSFVDPDRLLYTFRTNVGIATTAQSVGGWESPTTELRGHSTGHLMSALAQAYANTGNSTYKTKGDYLVSSLAACQAASPGHGYHTGYLSAFPENFFDRLETGQTVWAPYYTIHKIMAGLLDQYLLAGNAQALTVVTNMAAWVKVRTDPLSSTTMQNVVLKTEFGGMPEVLTNLYQVSSNPDHLTTAQRFDHAQIENPLAADQDQLSGFHGNTQIPKIIGAIRGYHATGTSRYHDIATNFWDIVLNSHTYVIGGNTNGEYFQTPNAIASQLSDTTCECCNTYNMLKLTRQLFFTNPARSDYMDYYERALYNQILGQQDPTSSHGFVAYYIPLRAGGIKTYSNDYSNFTCDHGTGMESNTKYADSIYFYSGETLYVNLFIASVLTWPGRGITITQATTFPTSSTSRLTVTGSGHIAMKIRVPSWTSGMTVKINGVTQSVTATPGTYLTLDRTWASGDVVDLTMPASLTFPRTNDNAGVGAVKYGAIVLAGQYGSTDLRSVLPTLQTNTLVQDSANPLHFTGTASTGPVSLIPFYQIHERYTVYWNITGGGTTPPPPVNVAWYKFDETSGTSAADAFGGGRTATLTGTTTWVAGRAGNAVHLNGSSGYVRLPNGLLAGAGDFSVAAWVNLDAVTAWTRIFDFGTGTTSYMFLTPRSSAGTPRFAITTGGAGAEQQINGPAALTAGAWTHVAVTLSGNTGTLYVNGAAVATNTGITLRPSSLGSTTQTWLGRSQYADPYLAGALDSVRVYGRALSASEVSGFYTSGT